MKTNVKVLLLLAMGAAPLRAQVTVELENISPTRSTFHQPNGQIQGASGGRVHKLARSPNGVVYAASEWGGLFRSSDDGRTWHSLPSFPATATSDVVISPTNPDRIYASARFENRINSGPPIYTSHNDGRVWSRNPGLTPPAGFCRDEAMQQESSAFGIAIDPDNPANVYVGTSCGLAVSVDSGGSWSFIDPTPNDPAEAVYDVIVHNGGIVDACTSGHHHRRLPGETTWSDNTGSFIIEGECSLAVSPHEPHVIFMIVAYLLFESDDGGATWSTPFRNPARQGRVPLVHTNARSDDGFDLWFGDVGLWRTSCTTPPGRQSGGTRRCPEDAWSMSYTRTRGGHDDVGDLVFAGPRNAACPVLFSNDGGVYQNTITSDPGCHEPLWDQPAVTPRALWVRGMVGVNDAQVGSEDLYFGTQDNGIFSRTAMRPPLAPYFLNHQGADGFSMAGNQYYIAALQGFFVFGPPIRVIYGHRGIFTTQFTQAYPAGNIWVFTSRVPQLAQFDTASFVLVTAGGVFVTRNLVSPMVQWAQLGAAGELFSPIGVQLSRLNGQIVVVAQTGNGDGDSRDHHYRYTGVAPGGAWQPIPTPEEPNSGFATLAVDLSNANRMFGVLAKYEGSPRMLMTEDGGETWHPMVGLDTMMTANGTFMYESRRGYTTWGAYGFLEPTLAAYHPADPDVMIAGSANGGVFVSVDRGRTWTRVASPANTNELPRVPRAVYAHFELVPESNGVRHSNIYLGTIGSGIWKLQLSYVPVPEPAPLPVCTGSPGRVCE